ncbi:hypothetical protein PTNB73_01649 [Pyrenophora teres f. teres]|uniref:Uncharacterized protein n=1 Tax=Pyrenophora teres f. teres TaxID=97479 RepID=A0A6S6VYF9_9PLEO|nr:hypothetical protein PTNB73_01649 [Pyrenophora teres f. teres]CAE7027073.1 hypothetical protein PTTW11_04184 [Pyrenophora teres f. teres]
MRVGDRDPLLQDAGMIANSNDFSETDFQDEEMSTGESDSGEDDLENVEMDDNSDAGSSGSLESDGADNQSSYVQFLDKQSGLNKQLKAAHEAGNSKEIYRLTISKVELEKKAEANYADLDSDTESKMNRIDAPSQPAPIRRSIAGPARPVSPSWPWSLLFPHRALHRDSHRLPYFAPDSRGRRAAASFRRLRTQPGAVSLPPNSIIPQTPITCLGHPQTQPQTLLLTPNPLVPQISTTFSLNLTTLPTPPSIPDTPANQHYGSKAISCLNAELYRKAQPKTLNYSLLLTYELTLVELITYLPMAYVWSGFLPRADAADGILATAKLMLWSRGLDVKPDLEHKCHILRSSLAKQLKRNLAALAGTPIGTSAATWMYTGPGRPNFIADTPLLYLTNGIVRHPQGEDRGLLSTANVFHHRAGHPTKPATFSWHREHYVRTTILS